MSATVSCECGERKKPINKRQWIVYQDHCNHSAFNGYRRTYSDYSGIHCEACGKFWRTKANYVGKLKRKELNQ